MNALDPKKGLVVCWTTVRDSMISGFSDLIFSCTMFFPSGLCGGSKMQSSFTTLYSWSLLPLKHESDQSSKPYPVISLCPKQHCRSGIQKEGA